MSFATAILGVSPCGAGCSVGRAQGALPPSSADAVDLEIAKPAPKQTHGTTMRSEANRATTPAAVVSSPILSRAVRWFSRIAGPREPQTSGGDPVEASSGARRRDPRSREGRWFDLRVHARWGRVLRSLPRTSNQKPHGRAARCTRGRWGCRARRRKRERPRFVREYSARSAHDHPRPATSVTAVRGPDPGPRKAPWLW